MTVELTQAILLIWIMGAMVFAGWHFYCYRRFSKQLRIDSFPVSEDTATAVLFSSCKAALGIHGEVKLMLNPKIKSPMLVGLCRPMILMPTSNMRELDLKLVLTHELMHLKRKDLWVKMLALLAGTLHWFNPFAHVLRKDISTWGELSCDEALAVEMSHEERKLYGESILNTLDNHSGINTAFCSSLCESRKHIERRLTMLLNVKKMKKHIVVFAVFAIVAIGSIGMAISALAASASNAAKPDAIVDSTLPIGAVVNYVSDDLSGPIVEDSTAEILIAVNASDEDKFTSEEWAAIMQKVEKGEILFFETYEEELEYFHGESSGTDTRRKSISEEKVSPKDIEEIEVAKEPLTEHVTTLSAEEIAGAVKINLGTETLISVKLSDEHKFTPKEWQEILKKIENGEIRVEAE